MSEAAAAAHVDHDDFYQKLRAKVESWSEKRLGENSKYAEWVLLAPDMFHLITRLALDPEVPLKHKAVLGGAIAYFVSPIDLMPEAFLGPVGYADDVGLAAFAVSGILNDVGPDVIRRHWAGRDDVLQVIQNIVKKADDLLGSGLVGRLRNVIDDPDSIFRGLGRMRQARNGHRAEAKAAGKGTDKDDDRPDDVAPAGTTQKPPT